MTNTSNNNSNRSIFRRSVCVVGGAGFLGSHLVHYLIKDRQCNVLVVDNLCAGSLQFVHPQATFEHADITKSESYLRHLFTEYGIEFVFNYAAWPYVPDSFARPAHVFSVNATGAINVINAAQEAGVKAILQVSSAELYGDLDLGSRDNNLRIPEHWPVVPHSTYGASKAAVDFYVQARWREAQTPCIALRQFNCVGERETHPYILPEIISQLHDQNRDQPAVVSLGNNSTRDFLYAGDAVKMACELLEKGQFGEVYNLGSDTSITVYELAHMTARVMGFPSLTITEDPERKRPWEIWYLRSDNSKLYTVIDSRPTVSLEEAIRRTIDSFRDNGCRWGWEVKIKLPRYES